MKNRSETSSIYHNAAAMIIALLAVWRMPTALGLSADSLDMTAHAAGLAMAAGFFWLLRRAFACRNTRMMRCAAIVGFLFALFTVVGEPLRQTSALSLSWVSVLSGLMDTAIYTVMAGATLLFLYEGCERLAHRAPKEKESLFSRLLGNGFLVFALLLAGWIPVWQAFYPGTFAPDSVTQFNEYMYEEFSPHHPLLHTLLLGGCMEFAMDRDMEGYATSGVAFYSLVQMVLMAAMLAYACHWLRKRGAPLWARLCVTLLFMLFPFYSLWSFCAQKDVLFGGLTLIFLIQLADLWRDGFAALRSPLRIVAFVFTAVLMMLMRNNGIYALCLVLPFVIVLARNARVRMTLLMLGCIAVYLLTNALLIRALDAQEGDSEVEMLSIPLQQLARTAAEDPDAFTEEERQYMGMLYPYGFEEFYSPYISDPIKWSMDSEVLEMPRLLSIWARVGLSHPRIYLEAFLIQNLPYFLPGSEMQYRFDLGVRQASDLFEIESDSRLPGLKACYEEYDRTLELFGLPGIHLLSDTAFFVWLCLGAFGLAVYRRQRKWMAALGFLLAIWITCLLGPIAIMRYMLGFFYGMPVILAAMLAYDTREQEAGMKEEMS